MAPVQRVTMFKLPREEDRKRVLEACQTMLKDAKKDGKPYILSLKVGETASSSSGAAQGYTLVARSEFASLDDMMYYQDKCAAHQALKNVVTKECQVDGPALTVYFEAAVSGGCA